MKKKRTKQEYLDLLNETIKYYSEDPSRRGVETIQGHTYGCKYYTEDGKMCAVGRCLTNPKKFQKDMAKTGYGAIEVIADHTSIHVERRLKPEYTGFSILFWQQLQSLHDQHSGALPQSPGPPRPRVLPPPASLVPKRPLQSSQARHLAGFFRWG